MDTCEHGVEIPMSSCTICDRREAAEMDAAELADLRRRLEVLEARYMYGSGATRDNLGPAIKALRDKIAGLVLDGYLAGRVRCPSGIPVSSIY